jgi:hypothetical protein
MLDLDHLRPKVGQYGTGGWYERPAGDLDYSDPLEDRARHRIHSTG